jgi:hypothetical protein
MFWLNKPSLIETWEYLRGKYHCTIDLLLDLFGLVCLANKTIIVRCHTDNSKPVKQEVNSMVILPSLVFPAAQIIFPACLAGQEFLNMDLMLWLKQSSLIETRAKS